MDDPPAAETSGGRRRYRVTRDCGLHLCRSKSEPHDFDLSVCMTESGTFLRAFTPGIVEANPNAQFAYVVDTSCVCVWDDISDADEPPDVGWRSVDLSSPLHDNLRTEAAPQPPDENWFRHFVKRKSRAATSPTSWRRRKSQQEDDAAQHERHFPTASPREGAAVIVRMPALYPDLEVLDLRPEMKRILGVYLPDKNLRQVYFFLLNTSLVGAFGVLLAMMTFVMNLDSVAMLELMVSLSLPVVSVLALALKSLSLLAACVLGYGTWGVAAATEVVHLILLKELFSYVAAGVAVTLACLCASELFALTLLEPIIRFPIDEVVWKEEADPQTAPQLYAALVREDQVYMPPRRPPPEARLDHHHR